MRFALVPGAGEALDATAHDRLREAVRVRWARFVHASIALLLVTGSINFAILALPPKVEPIPYHPMFGVKVLAALAVFFIATALVGRSAALARMRQARKKWLTVSIVLAALIVLLSGILSQVRISPRPVLGAPAGRATGE